MCLKVQRFHNLNPVGLCVARFFQMLVISRFVQDWGHDCYANNWLVWKMSQGLRTQYLVLVECGNQITQNDQRKIKL